MQEPTVLRTTKIGGGFVKEDVMQYLDELNSKIVSLETELQKAQETGPADPQEIVKYRNQVDSLQEKLNASNNALRAAKAELDAAKKQHEQDQAIINQLKSGKGAAPQGGAQPQVNPAELAAAKSEIEKLKNQLKVSEQKLAAAQKSAQTAASAPAASTAANDAELAKAKNEITKITGELTAKENELTTKTREIAEKDTKISQLSKEVQDKTTALAKKDDEISKLNDEIVDLKEKAESGGVIPSSFDMGALFTEAQKTANKITIEAKHAADKMTKSANEEAARILNEANTEAAKTIESANTTAEACIKEANEQAKMTVMEANINADKVNEMSEAIRKKLKKEIESVNTKFNDIAGLFNRLSGQATDRMNEAQIIIGEARKAVGEDENSEVKKAVAPTVSFEAKKAPSASFNAEEKTARSTQPSSQPQTSKPYSQSHDNKPSKKAANFNFDMSELLKAAEEEAAKNPEE